MVPAFRTGQRIRSQKRFPIHRVFVYPFIRCVQTASKVVSALSAVDLDPNATYSKDVLSIDKSKLKVTYFFSRSHLVRAPLSALLKAFLRTRVVFCGLCVLLSLSKHSVSLSSLCFVESTASLHLSLTNPLGDFFISSLV
ncbi:uncharacterized protein LOC108848754 [Raphanus sativus]|uniref:Uncharacterized protein LOC108848754 n=1 Tax=Raphanus sativus TaxID=3726 RepID=A0A6J0MZ03_RAPSA|nr:uncharacterized protein LOC108848754 [Raphanus sativus]